MKQQPLAEGLPHTGVAAQTTDNTAASSANSGTVKIGKGSDESCTINLTLTDSHFTVISNTGDGSSNVNTAPARPKKKVAPQNTVVNPKGNYGVLQAFAVTFTALCAVMLTIGLVKKNLIEGRTK